MLRARATRSRSVSSTSNRAIAEPSSAIAQAPTSPALTPPASPISSDSSAASRPLWPESGELAPSRRMSGPGIGNHRDARVGCAVLIDGAPVERDVLARGPFGPALLLDRLASGLPEALAHSGPLHHPAPPARHIIPTS